MKLNQILRAVTLLSVTCGFALASTSCEEENNSSSDANFAKGTVEGYVTDAQSARLADVKVTLLTTNAKREVEATVTTSSDGTFKLSDVPMTSRLVTFEKDGYASVGITLSASSFEDGKAVLNPVMEFASAVITGKVLDAQNGSAPLAGATVSIGNGADITTGSDGIYKF